MSDFRYDIEPGVVVDVEADDPFDGLRQIQRQHERELERAYKLGVLHGINAQSLAQVENDVLAPEDLGWDL